MRGVVERTRGLAFTLALVFPCTSLSSHITTQYSKLGYCSAQGSGCDCVRNPLQKLQLPSRILALRGGQNDLFDQSSRYAVKWCTKFFWLQLDDLSDAERQMFSLPRWQSRQSDTKRWWKRCAPSQNSELNWHQTSAAFCLLHTKTWLDRDVQGESGNFVTCPLTW